MRYSKGYKLGILATIDGHDDPEDWPFDIWDWEDCEGAGSAYCFDSQQEAFADAEASVKEEANERRAIRHLKLVDDEYVEIEQDCRFYKTESRLVPEE